MKPGKDFEDRIRRRLEQAGCYVLRLTDAPAAFDPQRQAVPGLYTSFTAKNPFDLLALLPVETASGAVPVFRAFALECKSNNAGRLALSDMQPHQMRGLAGFPGLAGVVVELRRKTPGAESTCFFVRVEILSTWRQSSGKKSINRQDLEQVAIRLPMNKNGRETRDYFDVLPLLTANAKEAGCVLDGRMWDEMPD